MRTDEQRAKAAEYARRYRAANRERLNAYHRAYRAANKKRIAAKNRAYYMRHRAKLAPKLKKYRDARKLSAAKYRRDYRTRHPELVLAYAESFGKLLADFCQPLGHWIVDAKTLTPLDELVAREEAGLL